MSKFTWAAIESLTPWAKNPRKNDLAAVKVADSIRRFGFPSPIITWNGQVVAGHTRLKAIQLVLDENPTFIVRDAPAPGFVPVIEHPFASQREADAYAIADNRLAADAQWDFDLLRDILADLEVIDAKTGDSAIPILEIWNKCDHLDAESLEELREAAEGQGAVILSAVTGEGVDALEAELGRLLTGGAKEVSFLLSVRDGRRIAWLRMSASRTPVSPVPVAADFSHTHEQAPHPRPLHR
jgi:hypothetical protein